MAGRSRRTEPTVIPTNSLVASARRYPGDAGRVYRPSQAWQYECYRHYAICGEARFAANFMGHALSRAKLNVVIDGPNGPQVQTEGDAFDVLKVLFAGKDGQEEMLELAGIHLTVAGEFYLVGRDVDINDADGNLIVTEQLWEIISIIEMKVNGTSWAIDYSDGSTPVKLTKDDVVIRVWKPSPAKRIEADSAFRSLLPILSEIEWLTRNIFAQTSSRLAGAGILFLPQEMSFPPPPPINGRPQQVTNVAEGFMLVLADAMMESLKGDGNPAEKVPIVVTAPGEMIDKARIMYFWSELDAETVNMRNAAITRFAVGVDMPPETVLGLGSNAGSGGGTSNGVSHWGAWQIEESTIKMHVEPMLQVFCNALTVGYLRPAIAEPGDLVDEKVGYDTTALRLRPDRSKEAMELYDRGLLSIEALLRENGFDVTDLPQPDEFENWLLRKVASGSATPEQVGVALDALGIKGMNAGLVNEEIPNTARPAPSLEDHPQRALPEAASTKGGLLLAACEPLVLRALERAGNRMRQEAKQSGSALPTVPSYLTHTVVASINGSGPSYLTDAWPTAEICLSGIAPVGEVVPALDDYVLGLFASNLPHSRERLQAHLSERVVL